MSSNIQELEPRVAELEATLATLIENLADNNAKFIDTLFTLARSEKAKRRSGREEVRGWTSALTTRPGARKRIRTRTKGRARATGTAAGVVNDRRASPRR